MILIPPKAIKKALVIKTIKITMILWVLYGFISGILLFSKPKEVSQAYKDTSSVDQFYSDQIGSDRAMIMDDPSNSGLARLQIIRNAKETLYISYFAIHSGESADIFFGSLLEAADRGVQVNMVLDGMMHGMKRDLKDMIYTFSIHPNMNLKFYEPLNLGMPWTLNNRLHDKFIIADHTIAMIGGRNIGDQYFAPKGYEKKITNDRDIIIISMDEKDPNSVLRQLSGYFNLVWDHPYTKSTGDRISKKQYKRGIEKGEELKENWYTAKEENRESYKEMNWLTLSHPTNKITLIHNPIQRFSKEPWCWYEITELMKAVKKSMFIQSPYVIPSSQMVNGFFNKEQLADMVVSLLTNSLASTPNFPAYSGYIRYRKKIVDIGIQLIEYQGDDSIHAKAFVLDDELTLIGSFNLDSRSTYLSTETMVVIHSQEVSTQFKDGLTYYLDKSLEVSPDYTYAKKDGVEEGEVRQIKKVLITILSYVTRWFEYML